MRTTMPTRGAAAVALMASGALFTAISALWESRVAGAILAAAAAVAMLWPAAPHAAHDACLACLHPRAEHHGICQACQRDVVHGAPGAPIFACERFSLR